jgi:PIN domain nuclease of toxin-antitoxin system
MRLLLDAHTLLWFVWDHGDLSDTARCLMNDPDNELLLSTGTIWEIAIKVGVNKLTLAEPYEKFMNRAIVDNNLTVLDISVRHVAVLTTLPFHHRDSFDRLVVAQAMVEQISLISNDPALVRTPCGGYGKRYEDPISQTPH